MKSHSTRTTNLAAAGPIKDVDTNNKDDQAKEFQLVGPASDYEKWVARLYDTPFFHPINNGLANITRLHSLLGNPMDDPNIAVIHIAGTNGKGSVALKISETLQRMNFNVGLYSSPHVSSFRERIQMNGQLISEEEVVEYLPRIYKLCREHDIPGTFFEITTALAFLFFQSKHLDTYQQQSNSNNHSPTAKTIIVLEAGLGGRLDATNVVPSPVLSIITSVGLDHTKILGDTREEIAIEKAGIMRPDTPVVVGSQVPLTTLRQYARDKGIAFLQTSHEVLGIEGSNNFSEDDEGLDYDVENSLTAKAAIVVLQQQQSERLNIPKTAVTPLILEQGMRARPSCRFEVIQHVRRQGLSVILDVAHNPAAMHCLVKKLRRTYVANNSNGKPVKFRFLLGISKDKDCKGLFEQLWPMLAAGVCTRIHLVQAAHSKATPMEDLVQDVLSLSQEENMLGKVADALDYDLKDPSVTTALNRAIDQSILQEDEILVVCGSVFLMVEARHVLGIQEPRDSGFLMDVLAGRGGQRIATKAFGNNEIHA